MKKLIIILLVVGLVLFTGCTKSYKESVSDDQYIIIKSASCGCCGIYTQYLQKENLDIDVIVVDDMTAVKEEFLVPANMQSCHTAVYDDYFIEGHVPKQAIDKLLLDKPDIAGIALPGMPSGSPGMPGKKDEDWIIYGIKHDGTSFEFMTI